MDAEPLSAEQLVARFDAVAPLTVGLEEEVFLVDPESLDLAPIALEVLAGGEGDSCLKPELPAAQVEIFTPPCTSVGLAIEALRSGRDLLRRASHRHGGALPMAAAVHPFAAGEGLLNRGLRYDRTVTEYGAIARRQLVGAFQVHVAVGGAERTRAVYNALRGHLPSLAALAANAPFYEGRDTGLASVRPQISALLPRQGVPPPLPSWDAAAQTLAWGAKAKVMPEPGLWWWELRPHVSYGTLEIRVPDTQTTLADAAAVAASTHCLVAWLAARYDAGEPLPCPPSWRIAENRWLACRDGVDGTLVDLEHGKRQATRDVLGELLEKLAPFAVELGCVEQLARAHALVRVNGALRQRRVAASDGVRGLARWLVNCFCSADPG